ncbi:MAG: hypothetical protein V7K69_30175 [Nostoc sp.]
MPISILTKKLSTAWLDILTAVFALGVPVRAASPSGEGYALLRRSNE